MGGRGSASGLIYRDHDGKFAEYGSEYRTILQRGMIKFVTPRNGRTSVRVPEETRTKGRVYATIGKNGKVKAITRYDRNGKKCLQIDLTHSHDGLSPHAHTGYDHGNGRRLSKSEHALYERILKYWKEHEDGE